ncbi:hypothetical protein [Gemmata sp.]|uniref:hypothetical protein n=1 Tax=Gemmata sp. TaxID=1914242 RepID=UPI003F6FEA5E
MAKGPPKTVTLAPDEYAARYVGRAADGRQFFLTNPFVPATGGEPGREFLALYLFDKAGALAGVRIEDLGTRAALDEDAARARRAAMLESLGPVKFGKVKVAPFRVEAFGVEFGFIPQPPDEPGEDWSVVVQPGNYMCFWSPWTSGEYDT